MNINSIMQGADLIKFTCDTNPDKIPQYASALQDHVQHLRKLSASLNSQVEQVFTLMYGLWLSFESEPDLSVSIASDGLFSPTQINYLIKALSGDAAAQLVLIQNIFNGRE